MDKVLSHPSLGGKLENNFWLERVYQEKSLIQDFHFLNNNNLKIEVQFFPTISTKPYLSISG